MFNQPLVVHYGGGVDSTAMLIGLYHSGTVPDLILFADTGSEKPETYEYVGMFSDWLQRHGFPPITMVKRPKSKPSSTKPGYKTLEGNCLQNRTLPSLAFGRKSCSHKWKVQPQGQYIGKWGPAQRAWTRGIPVVRCIGFDCSPVDSKRTYGFGKHDGWRYQTVFPLIEWAWDRKECIRQIVKAGLAVPVKSACFFCPASKPWEVLWLAWKHPDLFVRAIELEDRAQPNLQKVEGLWRSSTKTRAGSWRRWAEQMGLISEDRRKVKMIMKHAEWKPLFGDHTLHRTFLISARKDIIGGSFKQTQWCRLERCGACRFSRSIERLTEVNFNAQHFLRKFNVG